jgi:hypothetical protein
VIYFAHPIDQRGSGISDTIDEIRRQMAGYGLPFYDPERAFGNAGRNARAAVVINYAALDACQALLAYLPDGTPSVGVPMEIERALCSGKHVVVLGSTSMMFTGNRGAVSDPACSVPMACIHLAEKLGLA